VSLTDAVHGGYVHGRRVARLRDHLAEAIPGPGRVLDVGCGDGLLTRLVGEKRPDLELRGFDVLIRQGAQVPVAPFDGTRIPCPDGAAEVVMLVDVIHHAADPAALLRDAARVAARAVVIKDHTREGVLAGPTLRFMDFVGNARHGVRLPYNYWTRAEWDQAIAASGLAIRSWKADLRLYPRAADWIFGRGLHFLAVLVPSGSSSGR